MATTKKYVSLEKLGLYDEKIKKVISDGDAASLAGAKKYTDDSLKLYEPAGTGATEAGKVQTKLDEEVTRAKAAEEANAGAAKKAQDDVTALAVKVGEVSENSTVVGMIDAVDAIADANAADITTMKGQIAALEAGTYDDTEVRGLIQGNTDAIGALTQTHATDKGALENAIALKADKTTLNAVSAVANAAVKQSDYDTKVKALEDEDARIVGLVEDEAERAAGVEAGLEGRIETMEAFWEAAQADGTDSNVIDTLKEIQDYIAGDETGASEMLAAINKNKEDIAAHVATDHDFAGADAALKTELEGKINAKADKTTVEALDGRVEVVEGKVADNEEAIANLEAKFGEGEGSVADMISDAVAVETEARNTAIAEVQADADKGIEDAASALAAANAASAHADELNTAMDTRVGVVEAKAHDHANKALLDTYTQTEADLADAVAKKHEHSNLAVLEGITTDKVTAWDKVTGKAEQTALQAEIDRATAKEAELQGAIDAFIECSAEEINAMFA